MLTLREVEEQGISEFRLRRLVDDRKVRRVRRGDEGRAYYLKSEILNNSYLPAFAA